MRRWHWITTVVIAAALSPVASADGVKESIQQAVRLYEQGDLGGAVGNLDYAAQLIRQEKSVQLSKFLPEALPGWTARSPRTSSAAGGVLLGGGISAEQNYHKDNERARVTISLITDSPLLQPKIAMFSNPMLLASSGAQLETLAGQRASVQYNADRNQGEINLVIDNRILVVVKGTHVDREELVAYAGAIKYSELGDIK